MKKIWDVIVGCLLSSRLRQLQEIEKALENRISSIQNIYTSVRTFTGLNAEYYDWVCRMLTSDEYKYMCFDLRENVIREMVSTKDEKELIKHTGRLEMINVIGNYLTRYKAEYEEKVLGNQK